MQIIFCVPNFGISIEHCCVAHLCFLYISHHMFPVTSCLLPVTVKPGTFAQNKITQWGILIACLANDLSGPNHFSMKKNPAFIVFAVLMTAIGVKANNSGLAYDSISTAPIVTVVNNCNNSVLSTTATGKLLWSTGETTSSITVSLNSTYYVTSTVNGNTSPPGSGTAFPKLSPKLTISPISVYATLNHCSALISFGPNVTVTGIPAPVILYKIGTTVITSPRSFPVGTTNVTVIATNSCGSVTKTFPITVLDMQNPSVTCKPAAKRSATSTGYTIKGSEFNATASDNCGTPSLIYNLSGATVARYQPANISLEGVKLNIGTTKITWKVTDPGGHIATCNMTVNVSLQVPVSETAASVVSSGFAPNYMLAEEKQSKFEVMAMPNPAPRYFTLKLKSKSQENLNIKVMDITGRTMEQKTGISANSALQIGYNYTAGIYTLEVCQGNQKIVLRLIKGTN